jgi:hypothetical protein
MPGLLRDCESMCKIEVEVKGQALSHITQFLLLNFDFSKRGLG